MLAEALSLAECQLFKHNGAFVVKSALFDPEASAEAIRQRAIEIGALLSGAAMVLLGARRRFEIGGLARIDEAGAEHAYVFPDPAVIHLRAFPVGITVTHPDGSVETHRPADPLNHWIPLAIDNAAVAAVLRIRARGPLDWDDLLRIIELVESSGVALSATPGAPSKAQLDRLTQTANSVHALGDRSRHPGRNYAAPPTPTTLADARQLVDQLVQSWLVLQATQRGDAA